MNRILAVLCTLALAPLAARADQQDQAAARKKNAAETEKPKPAKQNPHRKFPRGKKIKMDPNTGRVENESDKNTKVVEKKNAWIPSKDQ